MLSTMLTALSVFTRLVRNSTGTAFIPRGDAGLMPPSLRVYAPRLRLSDGEQILSRIPISIMGRATLRARPFPNVQRQ
jgi:hypothetical protein